MHILVVDDERPARSELCYILQQLQAESTIQEARNGSEALHMIAQTGYDVVFLDIAMPGISGLGVAAAIAEKPNPPLLIFATAYDAHAVRAFELAALDYVVKPFSEQRLAKTLARVRQVLDDRAALVERQQAALAYLRTTPAAASIHKIWCQRDNETIALIDYAAILWIEAQEKKVFAQTIAGEHLPTPYTLSELEERLQTQRFVRVHKGYLVNLDHVSEVVPWFSGTYLLRLNDAARSEIPMSRQYAKEFKEKIG
jgi:two-component system LytT family response regulator/two-component system response regulator LytT